MSTTTGNTTGTPTRGDISPTGTFVRNATGLVREIGPWGAIAIAIGSINIGGGFIAFFYMLGVFPKAVLPVSLILGLIGTFLLAAVYVQLAASLPRTGGDYVFASRLLHPVLGASIGGAEFLLFATFPAFWLATFASGSFQALLASFGQLVGWHGLVHFANVTIASGTGTFLVIGVIALIVLTAAVLWSTRFGARILEFCFVVGVGALLVGLVVLLTHSHHDFIRAFNATYKGKATYGSVLAAGTKVGYSGGYTLGNTIGALPYATLLVAGFSWAVYQAGELRNVSGTMKWSAYGSGLIATVIFVATAFAADHALGARFMGAANFVSTQHPSLYTVPAVPSMTLYTGMLTSSNVLHFIINLIPVMGEIGIVTVYLFSISRVLFALSFDRLFPAEIRSLSRRGTPGVALLVAASAIAGMLALALYTNVLTVWSNGTLALAIIFTVVSIATISLVHRHREIWASGPRHLAVRVFGIPLISIVSALSAAFSLLIVVLAIVKPLGIGPFTWKSVLALVLNFAWGVLVYYGLRYSYRRKGVNLGSVLTEIPPE